MFGQQAIRLLRETWKNATQLAEELYALFQNDIPLSHNAPITLVNTTSDAPALTVKSPPSNPDAPPLKIVGPDGTSSTITVNQGNVVITNNTTNTTQQTLGDNTTISVTHSANQAYPGQVVSGSGSTYNVRIFPNGLSGSSTVVSVRQLQISSSEQIPAGTWAIVVQSGQGYFMQVPVWL